MIEQIVPGIHHLSMPLPNSPLKTLNCYIVKTPERNLIIDTGFNRQECYQVLSDCLAELEIDMHQTDILVTHLHSDHVGLAPAIAAEGTKIYMSELDGKIAFRARVDDTHMKNTDAMYLAEGFPQEELTVLRKVNPALRYAPERALEVTPLKDGDVLQVGDFAFECIETPGHSPSHICMYLRSHKLMVLGDHVLFDITPNITIWKDLKGALATYMQSLKKIRQYDVEIPLPAHRGLQGKTMVERIDELLMHHKERLIDAYRLIRETPGSTGYEIASGMKWSIRAKSWSDFPLAQKWFATGEALSHLEYLLDAGYIKKELVDGVYRYYVL